jgi:hypothetical protein
MSQTRRMTNETIKKRVREFMPDAVLYREDDKSVLFLVDIVTSKQVSWARLPYVQFLPHDSRHLIMVVYQMF